MGAPGPPGARGRRGGERHLPAERGAPANVGHDAPQARRTLICAREGSRPLLPPTGATILVAGPATVRLYEDRAAFGRVAARTTTVRTTRSLYVAYSHPRGRAGAVF